MTRVSIIGSAAASLETAEHLIRAGMKVSLFTEEPAPFGLLNNCPDGAALKLIGNIRIGEDVTMDEILHDDAEALLRARGVAFTTFSVGCPDNPIDWALVHDRASKVPVCF
ncbi:ferredoxin [Corynebacterium sp. L4756]|uniref:ferredoxin n=1 Tax=unclassified Corynebacterium TaxID=2624378 RepID=UPI00374DEB59